MGSWLACDRPRFIPLHPISSPPQYYQAYILSVQQDVIPEHCWVGCDPKIYQSICVCLTFKRFSHWWHIFSCNLPFLAWNSFHFFKSAEYFLIVVSVTDDIFIRFLTYSFYNTQYYRTFWSVTFFANTCQWPPEKVIWIPNSEINCPERFSLDLLTWACWGSRASGVLCMLFFFNKFVSNF